MKRFSTVLTALCLIFALVCGTGCAQNASRVSGGGGAETLYAAAENDPDVMDDAAGFHDAGLDDAEFDGLDSEFDGLDEDGDESDKDEDTGLADPLRLWNKAMFHFNDKLYHWVLKPAAKGYKWIMPERARKGVKNFFTNIMFPVRFANCLLQGKVGEAGNEFCRFVGNTTAGVLGFMDPAGEHWKLEPADEDFGQTLGSYGLGDGIYLVWPFLGPSTLRDTVGMAGDSFLSPIRYVEPSEASLGITGYKTLNNTSLELGLYETLTKYSVDPYEALKDFYLQYRRKKIKE